MKIKKLTIKEALIILSASFILFATIVLSHLVYTQHLQNAEVEHLKESHNVVVRYLTIAENERKFLEALNHFANSPASTLQDQELNEIEKQISDWELYFNKWVDSISILNNNSFNKIRNEFFNKRFIEDKKRQGHNYKNSIKLCKKRNLEKAKQSLKEAKEIVKDSLEVEKKYSPSVAKTIKAIINSIQTKLEADKKFNKRIYMIVITCLLISVTLLIYFSFKLFANLIIGLQRLKAGAERIINEDYNKEVKVRSPEELAELAKSFNEMQSTIKERDKKILTDKEKINSLNEELSMQVDDGKQTISKQNLALTTKNEELEQILYAASHDLRTPLISIQGFSEELKTSCNELKESLDSEDCDIAKVKEIIDDEINSALKYIVNGSTRMELLLEGLLRLSRMGKNALDIQDLDMNELANSIKDSVEIQLNDAKAELSIETLENCKGDRYMIEQILLNFVNNAIKYRSSERECKIMIYSEKVNTELIRYYVEDNGIGLTNEQKEKVFNAFYRVSNDKVEGDGVGLSIARRAIDLHSGSIGVESEEGLGSIFYFEIPTTLSKKIKKDI